MAYNNAYKKKYLATKRGHLTRYLSKAKERAKKHGVPIDIDLDYLDSIATDKCPVFKCDFVWGQGNGSHPHRPSLDRIVPELGYIKGNVAFISNKANTIKNNVTEKELYAVADWVHDERKRVLNAQKRTATQLSKNDGGESKDDAEHRVVHGTGIGKDCNGSHHHIRKRRK